MFHVSPPTGPPEPLQEFGPTPTPSWSEMGVTNDEVSGATIRLAAHFDLAGPRLRQTHVASNISGSSGDSHCVALRRYLTSMTAWRAAPTGN